MTGGKILDQIEIKLQGHAPRQQKSIWIDVFDNSLSRKWLPALNHLLSNNYHLEKNYCFLGFALGPRNGWFILNQVNRSISAINRSGIGYTINDYFDMSNVMTDDPVPGRDNNVGRNIIQHRLNQLHRYFEDLQGTSGNMSQYYQRADAETQWHIRQLNLLCHEFESWALSYRKKVEAPDWQRPSQLMCWLNAPRFKLDEEDYELFGVDTLNRPLGGVFVGVNKAIGKHHYEVFCDEGRDSRISELTTSSLRSQTEASGDFDIEWGRDPRAFEFQQRRLADFRAWLVRNGFDPNDKSLTIGHPQVAQVDLRRSFGTEDFRPIWDALNMHLDVVEVATGQARASYQYHWDEIDFRQRQVEAIKRGHNELVT